MNSKLIGYVWFSGITNLGIVLCQDQITGELKAWIAAVSGLDIQTDINMIKANGSKFPILEAANIITNRDTIVIDKQEWALVKLKILSKGKENDKSSESSTSSSPT